MGCTLCWAMAAVALFDGWQVWPMGCNGDRGATPGTGGHLPGAITPWCTPDPVMKDWGLLCREQLRDGDVVFTSATPGSSGAFPEPKQRRATGSRFSHTGVVAAGCGEPVIYEPRRVRHLKRMPFALWMAEHAPSASSG